MSNEIQTTALTAVDDKLVDVKDLKELASEVNELFLKKSNLGTVVQEEVDKKFDEELDTKIEEAVDAKGFVTDDNLSAKVDECLQDKDLVTQDSMETYLTENYYMTENDIATVEEIKGVLDSIFED